MIKKIRVDQLRPGMFIDNFNCSWLHHPFCRNNLKVNNEKIIKRIIESGIREVNIDTDRGLDIADVPAGDDTGKEIQNGLREVVRTEADDKGPVPVNDKPAEAGSTVQNLKKDTIPGKRSEIQGGTVPLHAEPSGKKGSLRTSRQITEDTIPGKRSEIQGGAVPLHAEPSSEKGSPKTARQITEDALSCTKFETQSSAVPVNGKHDQAKETGQTVQEMMKIIRPGRQLDTKIAPVPVQEELVKAKEIKMEAKKIVRDIMDDIKLGKQLEMKKVNNVVDKMVNSILRNKDALTGLGRIKKTDEYTFMHSVNVGILMVTFGKHLGFDCELLKTIGIGGLLHDMGKTKVPNELLTKKGRLSEEEMVKVKKHVEHSNNILKGTAGISEVSVYVAAHHHERLDGTGYPNRLKAEDINIFGQMSAIVDVYDALTSDRCYQKGILPTLALKKLHEWKMYFNKDLLHQFIRCIGIYPVGSLVRLQSGLLGVVLSHNEKNLLYPFVRVIYDTRKNIYIMPFDIDLMEDFKKGGKNGIICCELPDKWKIRTEAYL